MTMLVLLLGVAIRNLTGWQPDGAVSSWVSGPLTSLAIAELLSDCVGRVFTPIIIDRYDFVFKITHTLCFKHRLGSGRVNFLRRKFRVFWVNRTYVMIFSRLSKPGTAQFQTY